MPVLKIKKTDGTWQEVWGCINIGESGGNSPDTTFILEDENGNQLVGVVVDELTIFDAVASDIKLGKVAATDSGVVTGTHVCE